MAQVAILGSGLVGKVIAQDLALRHRVIIIDKDSTPLRELPRNPNLNSLQLDVTDQAQLRAVLVSADLVVMALPGSMAFGVLRSVLELGKSVVDISFYPEDPLTLDDLAKQKGVTAVVDCGIAPGLSNFLLGYQVGRMQVEEFTCYVGGLPVERRFPFEYKAPFSPADVIEEYTRPARLKEHGQIVTKPALSDLEWLDFPCIGTLEAFNTDGLRTLLYTMPVPTMREKTLRYPGHARLIQALKTMGFFDAQPLTINGQSIKPIDLTSALLKKAWELDPEDEEFTIMRVLIRGQEQGRPITYQYDLLDRYDKQTGFSSMARTTGFMCSAVANLILAGLFTAKGIFPPELVVNWPGVFEFVTSYLAERGVRYTQTQWTPQEDCNHHERR